VRVHRVAVKCIKVRALEWCGREKAEADFASNCSKKGAKPKAVASRFRPRARTRSLSLGSEFLPVEKVRSAR